MAEQGNKQQGDPIAMIKADHQRVEELFQRIQRGEGDVRASLDELERSLLIHAQIEEEILYPAIREMLPDGSELAEQSLEDHQNVRESIESLRSMSLDDETFEEELTGLMEDVRMHVESEEDEILPQVREQLSPDQLQDLGRRLTEARRQAEREHREVA